MNRRATLATLGGGAAVLTASCLSVIVDTPESVHFELWNRTKTAHEVGVTIHNGNEEILLDRTYTIEDSSAGPPGGNVIREESFTEAKNGALFDIVAILDQRSTWKHRFQVMCNGREAENLFLAEIDPGKETSVEFDQSICA